MTVGTVVFLEATFRDRAGALFDPATVRFDITLPNGTSVAVSGVTSAGTGVYRATYTTSVAGVHRFWYRGTGPNATGGVANFTVTETPPA
ncbi:hypothetical protein [Microcystis phage Mae-JY24]